MSVGRPKGIGENDYSCHAGDYTGESNTLLYPASGTRMFRSAFLASALLGSGLGPVCFAAPIELPSSDDGAATHPAEIRAAIEMFEQGDVNGAFERLKTSAADYPHLPPPRIMLANLYFSSDNYAAGRLSLEQAAVEHPEDPETLLILGDLLIRERRWTEADALYGRGEALWKEFKGNKDRRQELEGRLCAGLAAVAEARTQWELATTRLKRWIEVAPKKMAAHQRLGRAYFMLKREKEAFAEFQLATANATPGLSHAARRSAMELGSRTIGGRGQACRGGDQVERRLARREVVVGAGGVLSRSTQRRGSATRSLT